MWSINHVRGLPVGSPRRWTELERFMGLLKCGTTWMGRTDFVGYRFQKHHLFAERCTPHSICPLIDKRVIKIGVPIDLVKEICH